MLLALSCVWAAPTLAATDAPLATAPAQAAGSARAVSYDGVVEAVRQTQIAAQVPGAVVELAVHAGDRVAAGQLLARIDARSADQGARHSRPRSGSEKNATATDARSNAGTGRARRRSRRERSVVTGR